ncbi:MAG: GNAT family N-acetyltransferase [Myxococcota bacterium]
MDLVIRAVTTDDLPALNRAFASSFGRTHADDLADQATGTLSVIVAFADGEPVGHAFVAWPSPRRAAVRERYPDCPEIHRLAVMKAFEHRGIGAALVGACEEEARRRDFAQVGLGTDPERPEADNLYHRLGYLRSAIDLYDDVYRVAGPDGEAVTVRDPARWLIKPLARDDDRYFARFEPQPRRRDPLEVSIRKATAADSRGVTEIWAERHGEDPADFYGEVHAAMVEARGHGWVAHHGDAMVGYAQLRWQDDFFGETGWALTGVTTRVAHRRRGLGRTLTAVRLDWLRGKGATEVYATINAVNLASIELHRSFGFVRIRRAVQPAERGTSDLYRAALT